MAWQPIATGLAATALAALQLLAWIALGSFFITGERQPRIALPVALLIGVAITGCAYALFAWVGLVHASMLIVPAGCALAIAVRRAHVRRLLRYALGTYDEMTGGRRWARWLTAAGMALAWLVAIAPPRDADPMRYHLAKIRLLDLEGVWAPIVHFCHSLPFGFSIHYLPFEHLGIPQGGQLLNLGLLAIALGIANDVVRGLGASPGLAGMLTALFAFQPWVFKVSTSAHVDTHLHLAMLTAAALVVSEDEDAVAWRRLVFLGFVAWAGTQARYQAVLMGVTVSLLVLYWALRGRIAASGIVAFGLGSTAGLALASPYYVYNVLVFRNPVWPLLVTVFNDPDSYASRVVHFYERSQAGTRTLGHMADSLLRSLIDPQAAPIPAMALGLVGVALVRRSPPASRTLGLMIALFLGIWLSFHSTLYARYSAYLAAWAIVGWAPVLARWSGAPLLGNGIRAGLAATLAVLVGIAGWYSFDFVRYDVTGDARAYHEFTPFWEVDEWVNSETPPDSRLLVVVTSGHSYYLNRVFRQAEPTLSAVIDWPSLQTPEDLDGALADGAFDYVVYEDRDWSEDLGGSHMSELIDASVRSGVLRPVGRIDSRLYLSRIRRQWQPVVVYLLERRRGPMAGRLPGSVPWRGETAQ